MISRYSIAPSGVTFLLFAFLAAFLITGTTAALAANVVVGVVEQGRHIPEKTFVGTVYYSEISDVSAEVAGAVQQVHVDEGQRVARGDRLVTLDSSMLRQTLLARVATYEQTLSDLQKANRDLERSRTLFERNIVAERDFDDHRFAVMSLEKRAASLKAEVERLEIELKKTIIRAPFKGIVVKKSTARGEWVSPGFPVATVADDTVVDIIVSVPEDILVHLEPGMTVSVTAGTRETKGALRTVIPRGDIATRTFPVKIGVDNNSFLMEGMEARTILPAGQPRDVLLVHRDALLNIGGETSLVTVIDSKAHIVAVTVVGYQDMQAAIEEGALEKGTQVVIKGNERLQNNQTVTIIEERR